MPPPIQNPCRVCACWAKAEVASSAVSSAQNPVARSVPISPLEVGERVCAPFDGGERCEGKLQTSFGAEHNSLLDRDEERQPRVVSQVRRAGPHAIRARIWLLTAPAAWG